MNSSATDSSSTHADLRNLESLCADLDAAVVRQFLTRLDEDYRKRFLPQAAAEHLRNLLTLRADQPAAALLRQEPDGMIECTVLAFDHPFEFSLITGALAGAGFSIETADAFTLPPLLPPPGAARMAAMARRRRRLSNRQRDPLRETVIVDCFRGRRIDPAEPFETWARSVEPTIRQVLTLLDRGEDESVRKAKTLVNERVTQWLARRRRHDPDSFNVQSILHPTDARIEPAPPRIRLTLAAHDAPALLYTLSTALSLGGFSIQRMRARTVDGRAVDQIEFVDPQGQALREAHALDRLKLSVLLTQQFAYFLDRAPDPFAALTRFEEMTERVLRLPQRGRWLKLLSDPPAMADLARVLGISDYLWEDFIRLHIESLLPIFRRRLGKSLAPSPRSLPGRLRRTLAPAKTFAEQQDRLNQFKDRELFLIDLEHILSQDEAQTRFHTLSQRLGRLAETLVQTASRLVWEDLVAAHGRPTDAVGKPAVYAVFGLGKLGGMALGYASDIELLFVYSEPGHTVPTSSAYNQTVITNDEFFQKLARGVAQFIRAKREGIFQVDLRLRPHGSSGPLACGRQQFAQYYGPGGEAHPFERLSLVRMRRIGGDARLGSEIEHLRDRLIYDAPPPPPLPPLPDPDVPAVWEITGKMHAQHLADRPGNLNSKFSPGALADLEQAVQLLQVMHARRLAALRTPRLQEAIEVLQQAGVLTGRDFELLTAAYQFFRRLINAQRMLRGSAKELFLPPAGSDELTHLARRMEYPADQGGAKLLADFQTHTATVRRFLLKTFRVTR